KIRRGSNPRSISTKAIQGFGWLCVDGRALPAVVGGDFLSRCLIRVWGDGVDLLFLIGLEVGPPGSGYPRARPVS
ncbi:hypothetical protein LINPERHAP1_LOCUS38729, partial [Linum perenne]